MKESWTIGSEGSFGAAHMRNEDVVCAGVVYVNKHDEYF